MYEKRNRILIPASNELCTCMDRSKSFMTSLTRSVRMGRSQNHPGKQYVTGVGFRDMGRYQAELVAASNSMLFEPHLSNVPAVCA